MDKKVYTKINNHVVGISKEDLDNKLVDCSKVEVLVWIKEDPYYKFEHNDLAQSIAENDNLFGLEYFETPNELIDKEILKALKERAMTYKNFQDNYEHNKEFRK